MNKKTDQGFGEILQWADTYIQGFLGGEEKVKEVLSVKMRHGPEVGLEARRIAKSLGLPTESVELASIAGVLHDIGRFEQFVRYRTFVDHQSVNHALLGAAILREHKVLDSLRDEDAQCILFAIENHNSYNTQPDFPESFSTMLKILRDADKIDILRIMTDLFDSGGNPDLDALTAGLENTGPLSYEVSSAIHARRLVKNQDVRNLNDLKMLYSSWVFDVHFPVTMTIFRERRYLDRIRESITRTQEIDILFDVIEQYFLNFSLSVSHSSSNHLN
jgi:putative nucleotidyltransferase with HDIG domain